MHLRLLKLLKPSFRYFCKFAALIHLMGKNFLLSLLISLIFVSCTPEHCFEGTESFLKARFYDKTELKAFPPDSVTLYGLTMDSAKIYNNSIKLDPAMIPLNPATDSVSFLIKINGIADTMTIFYSSYYHFLSKECGFTYYHDLKPNFASDTIVYTRNAIDSIYINKIVITTENEENIRIYY
jgi:hypothetical protein